MKHLFIHSAWLILAVLAPMAATATTLYYITTTITNDVDQDPNRDGVQKRYDWTVANLSGNWTNDAVWQYTIQANLESREMYGFTNSNGSAWSTHTNSDSFYWLADQVGNSLMRPGYIKTFSALIDQDQIIGNESVGSYGISNEGQTNPFDVTIPITRSQTSTNGTSFGWLKDHDLVADTNSSASYAAAALADSDSDGFANGQEYIADSDPNSSNSFFRIIVADSALSWHSATGRVYTVKGATNLTETFTFITNFTGVAGTPAYTNAGADGFRFYRVHVELAP